MRIGMVTIKNTSSRYGLQLWTERHAIHGCMDRLLACVLCNSIVYKQNG